MEKVELKNRLREALNIRGMKAVDLCEKTGIPKSAVSYYLSGKSEPKSDRIYLISKALNISEAWLLGYDVPMARTEEQKINDAMADIVDRMKNDLAFFEVVNTLYNLDPAKFAGVQQMLNAFK